MGLFDLLFGGSKEETSSQSNVKKEVTPFVFKSNHQQRYENRIPTMGLQEHTRTVHLEKNTKGCSGYKLQPGRGFIIKIWNDEFDRPNMSDKPMDLIKKTDDCWEFRGFHIEAQSPFGWMEIDNRDYGFVVYLKNGEVDKCVLHMYDRNIYIEYMK